MTESPLPPNVKRIKYTFKLLWESFSTDEMTIRDDSLNNMLTYLDVCENVVKWTQFK